MRAKITWRVRRWSEGAIVEELPEFRRRYGNVVAEVVELVRDLVNEAADQPSSQDRKKTLGRIRDRPASADLSRLDSITEGLMLRESWNSFRQPYIELLSAQQRVHCAEAVLRGLQTSGGRPQTSGYAAWLVCELLRRLPPGTKPVDRDALLREALQVCGLGASPRALKGLVAEACRAMRRERPLSPRQATWLSVLDAPNRPRIGVRRRVPRVG